ncbi:MAG: S9 family peptidase [Gemmatimonadota bacterium]
MLAQTATAETGDAAADRALAEARFQPLDVFALELATDPRISPDGERVVYVRRSNDIMNDRARSKLWMVNVDGTRHRPIFGDDVEAFSPRWSPSGDRLLYASSAEDDGVELFVRWMDTGQTARLTQLESSPGGVAWSPDGEWLAFTMFVPEQPERIASMPPKPEGAEWAPPARVFTETVYRQDGGGYVEPGHRQIFLLPAEGGTVRQLTFEPYDHGSPVWAPDGRSLYYSANPSDHPREDLSNSEIYKLPIDPAAPADEPPEPRVLTDRYGPDSNPTPSPDGRRIAYTGFDDRHQGYQVTKLYVMDRDGGNVRVLTEDLDRSVGNLNWSADGDRIYFQYTSEGVARIAYATLDGEVRDVIDGVGGLSTGRPYAGGTYSIAPDGRFVYTIANPERPADLAAGRVGSDDVRRLTRLNDDLFGHKELGAVEEIWYESSHDGRPVQGWIIHPPGFDPSEEYPLILEIHGGPFSAYGPHFTAELQLYAAAGYVVLYTNPRGSTSYGGEFGNLIHHAYPSHDYDDLMSGVDAVIERGYIDEERLYVTGGSGGGVLSAWIVGHTDRFAGAVVQKPVINWYSWALTADMYPFGVRYWFPGTPWENTEHYMERSPISYVGNVTTPTMLITGEVDYRTPMSESRQFYQALQLRQVPTALVEVPGASHGIASRPSGLIAKVVHVLEWFERHGGDGGGARVTTP